MNNLVKYYYENILGHYPKDENNILSTEKFIHYLKDNEYTSKEIINILDTVQPKESLDFNDLPDFLWDNSLLEKDTLYYHNILHIKSKPPIWNVHNNNVKSNKFFLEMKIKFTIEDLINYFYENIQCNIELQDKKKDEGAIKYLLEKYNKLSFINSIDFILSLIDYSKEKNNIDKVYNILQLSSYENEVCEILENKIKNSNLKIIWR